MIRHIVFFRLVNDLPEATRKEILNEVKLKLQELPALIPEIRSFEVGINLISDPKAADLSLLSDFTDLAELKEYQDHPAHKAFIAWNRDKCPKYSMVDYWY